MPDVVTKTKKGLQWSAIDRLLTQGIQLVISLLLARLLGPTVFGLIGMLTVFIAISNVFIDGGFSSALIRKIECTDSDFSTAFYYNIIVSALCYSVLYLCSPYVAIFYKQPELATLLRVLGLVVIINSFTLIPKVKLTILMNFKAQAKISIISVLISGACALLVAYHGYGVWALVVQILCNSGCNAILFNLLLPWRPVYKVTRESFNYLFGFGSKLLLSGLLDVSYNNLYQIIIGKKFTPDVVGQFTQANQLASVPAMTLTNIIQRVTFPLFSQIQNDKVKIEMAYRLTLKLAAVIIFPIISGIGLIAYPLLIELLGKQWGYAANLLSILCVGYMLYPIHAINLNLLQVTGRTDLFLKLEIFKKIIGISVLIITIPHGVLVMTVGLSMTSYLSLLLNTYYTAKLSSLSQWQQCKDILPIWFAVIFCSVIAYYIGEGWKDISWLQLLISLSVALISYIIYLLVWQRELLLQLYTYLRR
ncbi:lipopolysaccharide biosynthesis protein [Edwardsiella tarda]|uniref:lipopolysaccharide biosynthesis protein n=1 Tax=Edwardsiella tarda TaxID=636 RepID=UPI00351C4E5B